MIPARTDSGFPHLCLVRYRLFLLTHERWSTVNKQRFWVIALSFFALGLAAGWLATRVPSTPAEAGESESKTRQLKRTAEAPADDGKLRIICFGAHPDDCELKAGGTAILWAKAGHHVKFVSVTNGDIGHWREAGGPLARRRRAEVRQADRLLGVTSEVLDLHDGELLPTLENRKIITQLIRDWKADVVISHRPNDYHPDHRYTGVLVQDSAYMVTVPFFDPFVPILHKNPVFLYYSDRFQKPNPFKPDVVVALDSVMDQKLNALEVME
jgi:LmbE family N-acetylglucosaminyl deacetylase